MVEISTLKASHLLVAYMEAGGQSYVAIKNRLKKSDTWLTHVRQSPEYTEALTMAKRDIADRLVAQAVDLGQKLDDESENSVNTIIEIRDTDQELGSTRLKAAVEILDRAPNAPKKRTETYTEQRTIIQLPIQSLDYMRAALEDCEEAEVIEELDNLVQPREDRGEDVPFNVMEVE